MNTIVKITVIDFGKFREGLKASQSLRDKYNIKITSIYRDLSNKNELFVISEYKDELSADEYLQSDELRTAMQESGIIGEPTMWKVDQV